MFFIHRELPDQRKSEDAINMTNFKPEGQRVVVIRSKEYQKKYHKYSLVWRIDCRAFLWATYLPSANTNNQSFK
jgi:hypothetical protein